METVVPPMIRVWAVVSAERSRCRWLWRRDRDAPNGANRDRRRNVFILGLICEILLCDEDYEPQHVDGVNNDEYTNEWMMG
jgi:hypothetical protein